MTKTFERDRLNRISLFDFHSYQAMMEEGECKCMREREGKKDYEALNSDRVLVRERKRKLNRGTKGKIHRET